MEQRHEKNEIQKTEINEIASETKQKKGKRDQDETEREKEVIQSENDKKENSEIGKHERIE